MVGVLLDGFMYTISIPFFDNGCVCLWECYSDKCVNTFCC